MNLDIFKNTKLLIVFASVLLLAGFSVFLFYFFNSSDMEPIYYNLNPEDAGKIVDKLKENKIKYKIEGDGSVIKVDSSKVNELRLMLASQGLPSKSGIGFEIFDKTKFGISGYSEKVNYRRALEGELSRTISSIEGVKMARVHLALPEPNIFVNNQTAASASVVVYLRDNFKLSESQIKGISYLVSSAVEGLLIDNVSIIDGLGRLIKSQGSDDDAEYMDLKTKLEESLSQKIRNILDGIYGKGKTLVSADLTIDMDKLQSVKEIYNPNAVIRSAITSSEDITEGEMKTKKNSSDIKYEMDKTIETYIKKPGNIKKISISVAVDSKNLKETDINNIKELVSSASGIDKNRGDNINVIGFEFTKQNDNNLNNKEVIDWAKEKEKAQLTRDIIKYSSIVLVAIILSILIFLLIKSLNATDKKLNLKQEPLENNNSLQSPKTEENNINSEKVKDKLGKILSKDTKNVSKVLEEYLNQENNNSKKEVTSVA